MSHVFISYSADDGAYAAVLLDHFVCREFGQASVFRASRSILPSENYRQRIEESLEVAKVVLAVVGGDWGAALERSRDSEGWLYRELTTAIRTGVPIVPVLLAGVQPLLASKLPRDLDMLAENQYVRFHYRTCEEDGAGIALRLGELLR